jgi:tryptophan synthase alpha subunit
VAASADAVVVGSAIVDRIARHGAGPDALSEIGKFVSSLAEAIKSV